LTQRFFRFYRPYDALGFRVYLGSTTFIAVTSTDLTTRPNPYSTSGVGWVNLYAQTTTYGSRSYVYDRATANTYLARTTGTLTGLPVPAANTSTATGWTPAFSSSVTYSVGNYVTTTNYAVFVAVGSTAGSLKLAPGSSNPAWVSVAF
jgi:hypothetical protein